MSLTDSQELCIDQIDGAIGWALGAMPESIVITTPRPKSASVVPANSVYGNNYCASSGAMPNLGISIANGPTDKLVLSWPTNSPTCHLEFASPLMAATYRQVVTNAPNVVGANLILTYPVSSNIECYRLSR